MSDPEPRTMADERQLQSRVLKIGRGFAKGGVFSLFIFPLVGDLAGYSSPIYTIAVITTALAGTWFAYRWETLEVNNAL